MEETQVSRGVALFLIVSFLVLIAGVPTVQAILEATGQRGEDRMPGIARVSKLVKVLPAVSEIAAVEDEIDEDSFLRDLFLTRAQETLLPLGVGNEQVYLGKDDWLFFSSDVRYVTAPGFLTSEVLVRRSRAGVEGTTRKQPDPRLAILDFHAELFARGIRLVVVPIPVKPRVHPEKLSGRYSSGEDLPQNPSFSMLMVDLQRLGVEVIDLGKAFEGWKRDSPEPLYLATDTHWLPETMERTAALIASKIRADLTERPSTDGPRYVRKESTREGFGDIFGMLQLPAQQDIFLKETVTVHRVTQKNGTPWAPDEESEVLLLGDSFSNIYSQGGLGWGEGAGLAEQLSYSLDRPLDCILRNDAGAYATRQELLRNQMQGRDRLSGKKIVVYTFAERELAFGDWKLFDLPKDVKKEPGVSGSETKEVEIQGTIKALATLPRPGSVPYRELVTSVHLVDVVSPGSSRIPRELVLFVLALDDGRPTDAARYQKGDQLRLPIVSWASVEGRYGTLNRAELEDIQLMELPVFWARVSSPVTLSPAEDLSPVKGVDEVSRTSPPIESGLSRSDWLAKTRDSLLQDGVSILRGKGGWLFFRAELDHLLAGKFWGADAAKVGKALKPEFRDPLPAILDLKSQLDRAGIELLVVPVPTKTAIVSDQVGYPVDVEPGNPPDAAFLEFLSVLRGHGVDVLDLSADFRESGNPAGFYCKTDTHWSPRACELVARKIGSRLRKKDWFGAVGKREFDVSDDLAVSVIGDLQKQLSDQATETKEELLLHRVLEKKGGAVLSFRESPVLLVGDSHTLVFHAGGDLLASGAGLFDHLSAELGFPPDLVGVRGSGSTAARLSLYRRRDGLKGKKVLIWCFAAREFTESTDGWRIVPLIR